MLRVLLWSCRRLSLLLGPRWSTLPVALLMCGHSAGHFTDDDANDLVTDAAAKLLSAGRVWRRNRREDGGHPDGGRGNPLELGERLFSRR